MVATKVEAIRNRLTKAEVELKHVDKLLGDLLLAPEESKPKGPAIVGLSDARKQLKCGPRMVQQLARDGWLHRVYLPGSKLAVGVTQESIDALLANKGVKLEHPPEPPGGKPVKKAKLTESATSDESAASTKSAKKGGRAK